MRNFAVDGEQRICNQQPIARDWAAYGTGRPFWKMDLLSCFSVIYTLDFVQPSSPGMNTARDCFRRRATNVQRRWSRVVAGALQMVSSVREVDFGLSIRCQGVTKYPQLAISLTFASKLSRKYPRTLMSLLLAEISACQVRASTLDDWLRPNLWCWARWRLLQSWGAF